MRSAMCGLGLVVVVGVGCARHGQQAAVTSAVDPAPTVAPSRAAAPRATEAATPTASVAPTTAACDVAARHIAKLELASDSPPGLDAALIDEIERACIREAWSPAVVSCILDAADERALDPCSSLLRAQRAIVSPPVRAP